MAATQKKLFGYRYLGAQYCCLLLRQGLIHRGPLKSPTAAELASLKDSWRIWIYATLILASGLTKWPTAMASSHLCPRPACGRGAGNTARRPRRDAKVALLAGHENSFEPRSGRLSDTPATPKMWWADTSGFHSCSTLT